MSWKRSNVSMPMTNAGILGITSDTTFGGLEMDPKVIMAGIVGFIILVKIMDLLIKI